MIILEWLAVDVTDVYNRLIYLKVSIQCSMLLEDFCSVNSAYRMVDYNSAFSSLFVPDLRYLVLFFREIDGPKS